MTPRHTQRTPHWHGCINAEKLDRFGRLDMHSRHFDTDHILKTRKVVIPKGLFFPPDNFIQF